MGLINLLLKASILLLDLRDTYDALDAVKLEEIGQEERKVTVRNAEDGSKQAATRRRVGSSKRKAAVKSALTTVLVWNLFNKVEPLCDRTIAWFVPFYDSFKTLFLMWMLFTRSFGASILVFRLLAPMVRPYEPIIDGIIGAALALSAWATSPLTPLVDRCTSVVQGLSSAMFASASDSTTSIPAVISQTQSRPTSKVTAGEKTKKKPRPPPSPPSGSKKTSSISNGDGISAASQQQPAIGTTKARQTLAQKTSRSNLAATRRVLQELPVPRHALEPIPPSVTTASIDAPTKKTNGLPVVSSAGDQGSTSLPVMKVEPSDLKMGSPSAANTTSLPAQSTAPGAQLGPPPTPPTGLHNFAFIPGMTPQRSGPSSVASPTPRFPGGFAFSLAASQASASATANQFQAQARVPNTAQMAPLLLSTQAPPVASSLGTRGLNNGAGNNAKTHESVALAQDDRIVAPPNGSATLRKATSSRSLKGKAAASGSQASAARSTSSSSKKRNRLNGTNESDEDEATAKTVSASPRKRAKAAAGKTTAAMTTARVKPSADPRPDVAVSGKTALRKAASVKGLKRVAQKPASAMDGERTAVSGQKNGAIKSRTAASRAASSSGKPSRNASVESLAASDPPQRLTRSRTKQNLVG